MGHKQTQRYYSDTRKFNYWSSVKQHEENIEELKIKVDNFNREADFKDDQNVRTYRQHLDQYNYNHDQKVRQFNRSNQIADEQIGYNRMAAHFAKKSLDNSTYERYQKLQFESAGALLKHRVAQQKLRQGRRELLQGHNLATAKAAITAQENVVKTMKRVGTAEAKGAFAAGRSLQKEVGQWWGVAGREQAAMQSMLTKANEQVATKLYGIDYTIGVELQKRDLTVKAQQATQDSIKRAYKLGAEEIMNKWEGADMKANHSRLLEPIKGPAPIKPTAMPRLDMGDGKWKESFNRHGDMFNKNWMFDPAHVKTLDVFQPSEPGLGKKFRKEHDLDTGDFSKDFGGDEGFKYGPKYDYRKDGGGAIGFGGTGARAGSISVGSVTSAVGAAATAAASIATATAAGGAATAGIGFGVGSISAAALGPIGMGIAAIGFIGTIFDWW